jgi:peptide/nickel transport system substrate-binding protein
MVFSLVGCGQTAAPEKTPAPAATQAPAATANPSGEHQMAGNDQQQAQQGAQEGHHYAEEIRIINDGNQCASMDGFKIGGGGTSPATAWGMILMFDRLIQATPPESDEDYAPGLATEWSTEDWVHFNFKLREGVKFQNDDPFTADDVVWTYNYVMSRDGCQCQSLCWKWVGAVNKIDDYNIEIVTKDEKVNPDLYDYLSGPYAFIANQKAIEEDYDTGITCGTGPYKLTEFVSTDHWTFEAWDGFWGDPVITKKLSWVHIPEINNRATMLINDEADLCMAIDVNDMDLFEGNPDFVIYTRLLNNCNPISFNMSKPITGDLNFRLAVLYAINKDEFAIAYKGKYCEASSESGMWGRYVKYRNTDLPVIKQDIEKAKEYLEKSVYNGETLELAAITVGHQNAVPVFQHQLEAIGIKTEIRLMQYAELNDYIQSNGSELLLVTAPLQTVLSSIKNWLYTDATANSAHYSNPEVDALIDKAMSEPDVAAREAEWKEVQRLAYEDHPYEHMVWFMETVVGQKGVGGLPWCTDCYYNMRYIYKDLDA